MERLWGLFKAGGAAAVIGGLLLLPFLLSQPAAADPGAVEEVWGEAEIGLVVDTTVSMGPELSDLAAAWRSLFVNNHDLGLNGSFDTSTHCDPRCLPLTATLHLAGFRDSATYLGNTQSAAEFGTMISDLTADGGGACPDDAFGGLIEAAKQLSDSKLPTADLMLITDATPDARRSQYPYLVSQMNKRGIDVHAVVSDWCAGSPIPEDALRYLALATGGFFYNPTPSDWLTDTQMALLNMTNSDLVRVEGSIVTPGSPDNFTFFVDDLMESFTVQTVEGYRGCLTCPDVGPDVLAPDVTFTLRDPDGQLVDKSSPQVRFFESDRGTMASYWLTETLKTGQWEVTVIGSGSYELIIGTQSTLNFAVLGNPKLSLDQPAPVRFALGVPNTVLQPLTMPVTLNPAEGSGSPVNFTVFDDGQHRDGQAGDGIYGGMVQPTAAGAYRFSTAGVVGPATFERVAESYHYVKGVRASDDVSQANLAGQMRVIEVSLTNETGLTPPDAAADPQAPTTFDLEVFSEQGWVVSSTVPTSVTLLPGETVMYDITVQIPGSAPVGTVEETTFVAVAQDDLSKSVATVAETTVADTVLYLPFVAR